MDGNRSVQGIPDLGNGGSGMSRAERFEDEKQRIIDSCFGRTNPDGSCEEAPRETYSSFHISRIETDRAPV